MDFAARHGPWAVVMGVSEGTGRAFARQIATQGVSCILVARREARLRALADGIRADSGVECVVAPVDLAAPDAVDHVAGAVGDREVGLFVSNAGADPNGAYFLDRDPFGVARAGATQRRDDDALPPPVRPADARTRAGRDTARDSGTVYGGSLFMAAYSASRVFTLALAGGLWDELRDHDVHVLTLVMGMTDTFAAGREMPADAGRGCRSAGAEPGFRERRSRLRPVFRKRPAAARVGDRRRHRPPVRRGLRR